MKLKPQDSPHLKATASLKHLRLKVADKGFALVATLMLMILLMLLAVGVLSLSTVTLRNSKSEDSMMEARANARMGLMIAIGELQKSMGPDRRISSRALTLSQDNRIGISMIPNNPRSWWVGATGTNSVFGLDTLSAVSASNPAAVWLVSGLDRSAPAASQLTQTFSNPVDMFGEYSIDLAMTGGEPITAGIVRVVGSNENRMGGYAYFVDDEGMKAQLVPSDVKLVNTQTPVRESDLTPGAYDVSLLDGMSALGGNPLSNYWKILSTGDLALLVGGDKDLAASKRLGYTTYSRGVLCDVKNGGLKRDLTVAFENDATFDAVFPVGNTADYLLIDSAKLSTCSDLQTNGYIHWDVFKDHYSIKRYIKTDATTGTKYLDPFRYDKIGPFLETRFNNTINPTGQPSGGGMGSLFTAGRLGPHDIGDSKFVSSNGTPYRYIMGLPYGNIQAGPNTAISSKNYENFKHSPVIPVLQRMQANAWMEQLDARTLRTHAQIWSSHYNPYNIPLHVAGRGQGPRMLATPTIKASSTALTGNFTYLRDNISNPTPSVTRLNNAQFTDSKTEFQAKDRVMLLPGRSHVLAFEADAKLGTVATADGLLYNDKVKDLTVQSVYRDLQYAVNLPASYDIKIEMAAANAAIHHGVDDNTGGGDNFEVCQTFWAPFAWDNIGTRPGKRFDLGTVSAATLNENKMASLGFNLRTTREADGVRPLVDANIRCLFGNTRWDSPMGLSLLAAYSPESQGVADEMIMQMSTVDQPKGYTYWGPGRDPSYGFDRVILFDIPRADLVSLGQLQHANAGRFSYEPTYIVGNSYANPRIAQVNWKESITDTFSTVARGLGPFPINGAFNLYDASYLVNEVLWDSYTFTTIPQVADNITSLSEPTPDDAHFTALARGQVQLPNARYLPYAPLGSEFDKATLQMSSNKTNGTGAFYHNAGHVLVDGAFNVNSTSVDAWEAFLSSNHSLPVAKVNVNGEVTGFDATVNTVRYPRVQSTFGDGVKKSDLDQEGCWTGFRKLEQSEVRTLAQAVVDEVKTRGPFLSMGDFVNRKLVNGELGASGALQAALDKTVNSGIDSDVAINNQGAGAPGLLLQGDVLQALAPRMTVRSDVFTIRAYGESVDAKTGKVLSKAWCEAKVQRFPDPVDSGVASGGTLSELSNPSSPFGRQFRMISFRWLNPNEI